MSPPAQKARPAPVITSTLTVASAVTRSSASASRSRMSAANALSFSGRLSVSVATPSRTSSSTRSDIGLSSGWGGPLRTAPTLGNARPLGQSDSMDHPPGRVHPRRVPPHALLRRSARHVLLLGGHVGCDRVVLLLGEQI